MTHPPILAAVIRMAQQIRELGTDGPMELRCGATAYRAFVNEWLLTYGANERGGYQAYAIEGIPVVPDANVPPDLIYCMEPVAC